MVSGAQTADFSLMPKWRRKFLEKLESFSVAKRKGKKRGEKKKRKISQNLKVIKNSVSKLPFPPIDILKLLLKALINHTTSKSVSVIK